MKAFWLAVFLLVSIVGRSNASDDGRTAHIQDSLQPTFSQYYKLAEALRRYEKISSEQGWSNIDATNDSIWNLGSNGDIIRQVRTRLFIENYLPTDSKSDVFDQSLLGGINAFKAAHMLAQDSIVNAATIAAMNVPIQRRIETIKINLDRARLVKVDERGQFVAVNIPSFTLYYRNGGRDILTSRVVVGKEATKTVVFNDTITQVIFNPYWNIPAGIAQHEILPAIRKNSRLFSQMNLEWHNGKLRQKPGKTNSLGLVKFMFPNSNDIYLHDTPAKSLFKEEKRTFSHGCIRVEKACELASAIMAGEFGWTEIETQAAMDGSAQKTYNLKNKIPIYIGYFTALVADDGNVHFYPDVYRHDEETVNFLRVIQK